MVDEVLGGLNLKPGDVVLDGTIGLGGHAVEILKRITPGGFLIGIDSDNESIRLALDALKKFEGSFKLVNENFRNIDRVLKIEKIRNLNAALLDVGISSYQIETQSRGFSIKHDARLDMRMDIRASITAYDIVNKYTEKDISAIIEKFGEERLHSRIARYIVHARGEKPIRTTHELAAIVRKAVSFGARGAGKIDPATKTFQALRIAVNNELEALEEGIKNAVSWLGSAGRICVISFHSLEDRIVKNLFKGYSQLGILEIVTGKPLVPSSEEIVRNPRSRSARLRIAERI
jgi:16S rRNA (cytosine1402-N4)-methyltransferase